MSSFEELEALDNKSLRTKCLEYGLPNVPITDTSRKILIKKLKIAMEIQSGFNIKGNKSRRETLHLTQALTNIEKNEQKLAKVSNRRTTIATVRKEKDESKKNAGLVEKRRTSRSTPINETSIIPISLPRKDASIIMEETDFEEEFMLIDDETIQPVVTNVPIIRKSRSPSLSKSTVVTTSYKKDTKKKDNIFEEEETEEEGYVEKSKEYILSKQFVSNKEKDICSTTIPRYNLPISTQAFSRNDNTCGYKTLYPSLNINAIENNIDINSLSNLKTIKRNYKPTETKKI